MGSEMPKQFLPIGDVPIIVQTLTKLSELLPGAQIIVPLLSEFENKLRDDLNRAKFNSELTICRAGETRTESVRNGLNAIGNNEGVVFIHDAVRPFITRDLINALLKSMSDQPAGAHVPVVPLKDSIRKIVDGKSIALDRSELFAVQTPQVFPLNALRNAYASYKNGIYTDDASLFEAYGGRVYTVMGDFGNFKITSPEDLLRAESLINAEKSAG
jgi:2-C-methyl-D-erythritol 4-phosphate cytidylyltransferase